MKKTIWLLLLSGFSFCAAAQGPIERMWQKKDYDELYEQRHRANRMSGMDLLRVAQAAHRLGHDSAAIDLIRIAINKGYGSDQHYNLQGSIYAEGGLHLRAAKAFRTALRYNHNRLPYMLDLAGAYYAANEPDSALAVYERIHTLFPDKDVATTMMCRIHYEQGRMSKAEECWAANIGAIKAQEYLEEGLEQMAIIQWHGTHNTEGADKSLGLLVDRFPDNPDHRLLYIQFLTENDRWEDARVHLDYLRERNREKDLPLHFYRKNALPVVDLPVSDYRLQIFEILLPTKENNQKWKAFVVTETQALPVSKWWYSESGIQSYLGSEGKWNVLDTLNTALDLHGFTDSVRAHILRPVPIIPVVLETDSLPAVELSDTLQTTPLVSPEINAVLED